MDRELIEEKIESIRRCVQRIESKRPDTVEALAEDWDAQDIIALNLTRAVQLCVDVASHILAESDGPVPDTMGASFDQLRQIGILSDALAERLQGAVGFRNIVVHAYEDVDWDIVFAIIHHHLDDFKQFARAVIDHIERS
jgi:uncharacterized protein YutE (UPF0331/DUF86 family)